MNKKLKLGLRIFKESLLYLDYFIIEKAKLYKLIPDKYYLIKYHGGKIFLNLRESQMMRARALGIYEYKKMKLFKKLVKPNMTILDIGVNKGYFSLLSAKLMKDKGNILSFEPDPDNCKWIKKSIAANNYKSIRLFQIALFNKNGKKTFFKGAKSGHHSLIKNSGLGSTTIQTQKLDDFIDEENITKINLIKIDVEGADIEVLEGAQKLLKNQSPKLIIDIHKIDRKKFFNLLENLSYNIFDYNNDGFQKITEKEFLYEEINEIYAEK